MALIHHVHFNTVREMALAIAEIYIQFSPEEPVPSWWQGLVTWSEEQNLDSIDQLDKALTTAEKARKKPTWWKLAERDVKSAPSVKTMRIRTEPFNEDDEDDEECVMAHEEDDGTGGQSEQQDATDAGDEDSDDDQDTDGDQDAGDDDSDGEEQAKSDDN